MDNLSKFEKFSKPKASTYNAINLPIPRRAGVTFPTIASIVLTHLADNACWSKMREKMLRANVLALSLLTDAVRAKHIIIKLTIPEKDNNIRN